jgi:hypothetical protein
MTDMTGEQANMANRFLLPQFQLQPGGTGCNFASGPLKERPLKAQTEVPLIAVSLAFV